MLLSRDILAIPYQEIVRRKSRRVHVGRVPVGDGAPITVQTMTNTLTTDVAGTIAQIRRAMQYINETTGQSLASTRQAEQAARDLDGLGHRLRRLLRGAAA